jgi:hypothetical protein
VRQAESYRRDRQQGQSVYLEVWVEAAGMVPQVASFVSGFSVQVLSSSGFDSVTLKRQIGLEIAARDVRTVIGFIGDHDDDGLAVIDSRADDVARFVTDYTVGFGSVEFEWPAVRPEQIDDLGLDWKPPKSGKQKRGQTVTRTVQAEAIDPPDMRAIVRGFVADYINIPAYLEVRRTERVERRQAVDRAEALIADG